MRRFAELVGRLRCNLCTAVASIGVAAFLAMHAKMRANPGII